MSGDYEDAPSRAQRKQVEALAGYGMPDAGIAMIVGVDLACVRARYGEELDGGQLKANAKVAENLYRKATGEGREAVTAAIFWLNTRAGWKETSAHEVTGRNGGPVEVERSPRDIAKAIAFALEVGRRAAEAAEREG